MHVLFVALQILLISNFVSTGILITKAAEESSATPTLSGSSSTTPAPSGPPSTTPSSSGPPLPTPSSSSSPSTTPSSSGPPSTTPSGTPTPTTSSTALKTTPHCTITGRFAIKDLNCQKYYYCYVDGTNIVMYELQCPNSLRFNPTLQKCVLPASYPCPATQITLG